MGRWVQYDVCVGGFVVDRCVRGGGSVGFRGGRCGCCLVGWVGVGLVDFFFFLCCGLWLWWWWLWLCVWLCLVVEVVVIVIYFSGYIILL